MPETPKLLSFTPLPTTPATSAAPAASTSAPKLTSFTPMPAEDADDETWLDWIGSTAKDLSIGAAKSLLAQGVRGGALLRKIPGVNSLDNLMTPIPVNTEPSNTTQSVGGFLFDVAESANPAKAVSSLGLKAASMAPKAATLIRAGIEGAGAAGMSALQGGDPTTAAAFGSAIPVAGKFVEGRLPGMRDNIEKAITQFFAPSSNRTVDIVERRVGDVIQRGLSGTRKEVLAKSKQMVKELGAQIGALNKANADTVISTKPLVSFLEDSKAAFREIVPEGSDFKQVALSPTAERALKQLSGLQDVVTSLGDEITVRQAIKLRRAWDHVVDQAGGFTERSGRGVAANLDAASEAWAAREGSKALRELLDEAVPDIAKLNKEFGFWKDVETVLTKTQRNEKKKLSSMAPQVAETFGRMIGTGASVASGAGVLGSLTGGFALGKAAKIATQVFLEPKWKLVGAHYRNQLADAIMANRPGDVVNVLSRIMAVQAGKAGQDE